jgi:hypothetical protein
MRRPLRNIALTVHELEDGEFYWVLLEGTDHPMDEILPFVALDAACTPYGSYSDALVAGVAAIRRMFGKDGPRS